MIIVMMTLKGHLQLKFASISALRKSTDTSEMQKETNINFIKPCKPIVGQCNNEFKLFN